jgi:capsular polysaccharide biosynthesis protein
MNETIQEDGISLLDLLHLLQTHLLKIILTTIIGAFLAGSYSWLFVTPRYTSNGDVMVQIEQTNGSGDPNFDYTNAFRLIDTIAELMKKEVVYDVAQSALVDLGYPDSTHDAFLSNLSIRASNTSYFINVAFTHEDPRYAQDAVDAIVDAVIDITSDSDAFPVLTNKIRRTSFATLATYTSPNHILFLTIGTLLGGLVGLGWIGLITILRTTFQSEEDIEKRLQLPVLGVIPYMNGPKK